MHFSIVVVMILPSLLLVRDKLEYVFTICLLDYAVDKTELSSLTATQGMKYSVSSFKTCLLSTCLSTKITKRRY